MTEGKKPPQLGDIDWDEALAEWEEKAFVPEVAPSVAADVPTLVSDVPPPLLAGAGVEEEADLDEAPAEALEEIEEPHPSPVRPDESRGWQEEKPASVWLDEGARQAFETRAAWLEEEARALPDKTARARGLLACSEILATLGDPSRAHSLAAEARELGPTVALAHRQARALMPSSPDRAEYVAALDAEVKMTPAGAARVHSTLLAADALYESGDADGGSRRLDQALRMSTTDVRAVLQRAARTLGTRETAPAMPRLPDNPEMALLAEAVAAALRLRGVEPPDVAAERRSPGELLRSAREALAREDLASAASSVYALTALPELAGSATWLAAALAAPSGARRDAARWLRVLVDRGDEGARRPLLARAIELGDRGPVVDALASRGTLSAAERVTLATLAVDPPAADDPDVEAAAEAAETRPLACAIAAVTMSAKGPDSEAQIRARARQVAGTFESRTLVRLGRLLASSAPSHEIEGAVDSLSGTRPASARAVALEMAVRAERASDVSAIVQGWTAGRSSPAERATGPLAAGLIAELAGDVPRALEAYRAARELDPACEAALLAVASLETLDMPMELSELADALGDGLPGALARIEAVVRSQDSLPEPTRAELLDRAHRAEPSLPIAAFLAEQMARRGGDIDEVVRWTRERRARTADPIESALHAIREALLVADEEPEVAGERMLEAHSARPADVALRALYERMAAQPPADGASWREQRATEAKGETRVLLLLEAAYEHEQAGDEEGALRAAEAAAATDARLGRIARERAELRTGRAARLADELLSLAKSADEVGLRREAYERLATLDATTRRDPASALLWHRWILEELPDYKPSLRHVEHHLLGEGRDDELEPVASAIADALRGTGSGECTAHAELAARLRMRSGVGGWETTREMAELAFAEGDPPLWSLRLLQAHARARGDDEGFLLATGQLVDRASQPAEVATLLARSGEAALRLRRWDEATALLERATLEDPSDVVAWRLLADASRQAGDFRRAAEACESLARSSLVREHQLQAWYDAARTWLDDATDEGRALVALEATAALDVTYEDVFDRLSRVYASRKMHPELAELLASRISRVSSPEERLTMGVLRGRVLLDAGDAEGARAAFQSVLEEHPDNTDALSAFVDLCIAESDWAAAEQALTRLARVLPTPRQQCDAYARLADLYAHHLLNMSRAEAALREVLARMPDDVDTIQKLVDIHKRQNDPARATELQQELVTHARTPEEKRARLLELSAIHEHTARDNRRAEQALEAARRELPRDVVVLRALAEFYLRHHQPAAANIILDRAAADARRDLTAGRWTQDSFEILTTVFELRGKKAAARTTRAMLDALQGRSADLPGANERAFDPGLDELVAPEVMTPALRALLAKTGSALDAAMPLDLQALKATPSPADSPVARLATKIGASIGLSGLRVMVSPKLGAVCVPAGSAPPTIVVGQSLGVERGGTFQVLRALKLVQVKASALARTPPAELAVLVSAWLKCFNPTWQPKGIPAPALAAAGARVQAALPRQLDPDVGVIALEVAGSVETKVASVGPGALAWANRVALLAIGNPGMALDAIAVAGGSAGGAPNAEQRFAWVVRTPEARDLLAFGVSDAFSEARFRLGLDR